MQTISPARAAECAFAALLLCGALAACAPRTARQNVVLQGAETPCSGVRYIDVVNPLNDEVAVWLRTADGKGVQLSPSLQPREERRYEVPGSVAIKDVEGRAAPTMRAMAGPSRTSYTSVNVKPQISCRNRL